MENIYINEKSETFFIPTVDFNAQTGVCELVGESYLEETYAFYKPLFEWLEAYKQDVKKDLTFNIRLTYFNTSSSKCILDILRILKDFENKGGKVIVNWYLENEDEDMIEEIQDFIKDTNLSINSITF